MDEDLLRSYRRWQALEDGGAEDEADRVFQSVFSAAAEPVSASRDFTVRTMAAVAAAAARDARRARRVRVAAVAGGIAGGTAAAYFAAGLVLSAVSAIVVGLLDLLVVGVVHVASAVQSGIDVWSVAASVGSAVASMATDARVAVALVMIQGVAIVAFVALRRLLGSDVELLK